MKHIIIYTAALATLITSCKTTEANYRAAYEQAVARRDDSSAVDATIYDKIRREAINTTRVIDGDTIPVKRERVKLAEPADGESLQPAYLVVAQFKQLFNARSLRDRLRSGGYPSATLLVTREPLYYVAIDGGAATDMARLCAGITDNSIIAVKPPYPLVLEPVK